MSPKYRFLLGIVLLAVVGAGAFYFLTQAAPSSTTVEEANATSPMGIGTPDDPNGRMGYEKMRLADPATGEIPVGIRKQELAFAERLPHKTGAKALSWDKRGPSNKGGRTRAFAYDVLDENVLLAGGVTGGMWRSTDGGLNWTSTTTPDQMHSVTCIAQDTRPGHENVWYHGTGESYGIVSATSFTSRYSGDGMFKSIDNGQSWTKLASTESNTPNTLANKGDFDFVEAMVTDHTDLVNDVVLAAIYDGIVRSTDGGATWTTVLGIDTTASGASGNTMIVQGDNGVFYAAISAGGPDKGIYRSDDGINWVDIRPNPFPTNHRKTAISISGADENNVYFIMYTPNNGATDHNLWKYTYVSGDGSGTGGSWTNLTQNLPVSPCTGYFTFNFGPFNSQSGYDLCIAAHPTDSNVLFIAGTNIYRSTDAFTSPNNTEWVGGYQCDTVDASNYVYTNHHPDNHVMFFSQSNPDKMFSANDGGVYKTDDAMTTPIVWDPLNNGYFTTQFYTVAIEPGATSSDYVIGGMQDNGTWFTNSSDPTVGWSEVGIDDGAYCAITENRERYVISSQGGRVYLKDVDDNGNILATQRIDPPSVSSSSYSFINPFILHPTNSNILYVAAGARIWRNNDLSTVPLNNDIYTSVSTNWEGMPNTQLTIASGGLASLEVTEVAPDLLYMGSTTGKLFRVDDATSTANHSKREITGDNFPNGYMSSIAVNPHDTSDIMVTFSNYNIPSIFHTTDGGASWIDVGGNLEANPDGSGVGPAVYWAEIYPTFPEPTYFVGTSVGLFSTNNLDSLSTLWEMEGPTTIGNVVINMIASRTNDGTMVVGTHGNGVYSAQLNPAFIGVNDIPAENAQFVVYPNPTANALTAELVLEAAAPVSMELFGLDGKLILSKSYGDYPAGAVVLHLDLAAENVSAGTYLLSVSAGEQRVTQRIVKQ